MGDGGGGRIAHTVTREEGRGGGGCYSWIFQGQVCVQWKEERDASVIESEKGTRQVFISPLRSVTESRWTIAICRAEFCSTVAWFLVGTRSVMLFKLLAVAFLFLVFVPKKGRELSRASQIDEDWSIFSSLLFSSLPFPI